MIEEVIHPLLKRHDIAEWIPSNNRHLLHPLSQKIAVSNQPLAVSLR
jgi:hypothetical protein